MATAAKLKEFFQTEFGNADNRKMNMVFVRSLALFAGSVFFMRNFGDLMAI